jgi:hypothetical protein
MRYASEPEACRYLGMERGALAMRRSRAQPPEWIKTVAGEVSYPIEALDDFGRREGAKIAAHFVELEATARTILESAGKAAKPLAHPELEATARDMSVILFDAGDRELAAKLFVVGNVTAEKIGRANPGMKPEQARAIAAQLVARCGYLLATRRRQLALVERFLKLDPARLEALEREADDEA